MTEIWQKTSVPESTDHWKQLIVHQGQESHLSERAAHIVDMLDMDLEALEDVVGYVYSGKPTKTPNPTADLVRYWQEGGHSSSLAAMCLYAVQNSEHKLSPEMSRCLMTAALIGEGDSRLPYHNADHTKKVLLQAMRLAHTDGTLDANQFALLLIAACIHDVGHDGKGNLVNGIHRQGRNELDAYNRVAPKLKKAGMSDPILGDLKVMLLSTDTSSSPDRLSYADEMKAMYLYHQQKDSAHVHVSKDLEPLQTRPDLALTSLMLHEADVATSAGLRYDVTQHESILFAGEMHDLNIGRPSGALSFMEHICGNQFLSPAGEKLYGANMAVIVTQLQADMLKGNQPFMMTSRYSELKSDPSSPN